MKRTFLKSLASKILTLTLLITLTLQAWAADYVIVYNGNYYNGTSAGTTTFDPRTCIWTGTSGGSFTNGESTTLTFNNNSTWSIDGSNRLYYTTTSWDWGWVTNTYYLQYNSSWGISSSGTGTYAATAYEVTSDIANASIRINTFDGNSEISATGDYTYTGTATYQAAYARYTWNNGNVSYGSVIAPVSATVTITASDLPTGTTFSDGTLHVNSIPSSDAVVTLTATARHTSTSLTATDTKRVVILNSTPAAPTISNYLDHITIASNVSSDIIRYTTDGSEPTCSTGTEYNGTFDISTTPVTIKAIACRNGIASSVATKTISYIPSTSVYSDSVVLMDWEDLSWTYYSGVDASVDGGNYNSNYLGKLYSPNARNIIIEYRGGDVVGASDVAISSESGEGQNTMIYYQTMEKDSTNNNYPYTVIPNPFSKRPRSTSATGNTDGFYGFGGWKIIRGGDKINGYNTDDVLPLDADITFTSSLATGDHIILEATWVTATVVTGTSVPTFSSGTYETNFWVLSGAASLTDLAQNMTVSARYPDGTTSYANSATSGGISTSSSFTGQVKIEWMSLNSSSNLNANGRNLYIGRGIVNSGSMNYIYGANSNTTIDQTLRVESGKYSALRNFGVGLSSGNHIKQHVILGCDYDRANNNNNNLVISGEMWMSKSVDLKCTSGHELCRTWVKSGKFNSGSFNNLQNAQAEAGYYYGCQGTHNKGFRYIEIQGGEWPNFCGGMDGVNDPNTPALTIRVKGGLFHGSIYGAAEFSLGAGTRVFIFTGGTVEGWIAGGANGTSSSDGTLKGATYLYVGGNTVVNSNGSSTTINRAIGGNVFGAGCGYNASSTSGQVSLGTNVVIADNAEVERGVYGGGAYGYCTTDQTSYVYITGGHVLGNTGGTSASSSRVTYLSDFQGGVYGGASQNKGGNTNIYMIGGQVDRGIYGGSNYSGNLNGSTMIKVVGGIVGSSSDDAHICGGGFGSTTRVKENIDVTIGGDATVYGEVYGGSEQGLVNTDATTAPTTASSDKHVNVNVTGGTIHGDVYGGGLGTSSNAANTYGVTKVEVTGGTVDGNVFGANNANGRPYDTALKVLIKGGSVGNVYGGGNEAAYSGTPQVYMTGGTVTNNVYGGGKGAGAALTGSTDVQIQGGNVQGNVYGGGHGATVSGNTNVIIGQ